MSAEIPSQFTHDIKLEETAKGVRISVHVYANNLPTAVSEALDTYKDMKNILVEQHIPVAPMEIK
jgi:hypothetical protein